MKKWEKNMKMRKKSAKRNNNEESGVSVPQESIHLLGLYFIHPNLHGLLPTQYLLSFLTNDRSFMEAPKKGRDESCPDFKSYNFKNNKIRILIE